MEPFGEEAQARIARHHAMRRDRGFETIECYRNLGSVTLPENSNVLLEDLGNLTANELFGGETFSEECGKTIPDRIAADIDKISLNCANLTIVANEVFSGGKDYEGETTTYLYVLARLSKILAERADQVVELVCGLPQVLKNSKESGFPEPEKTGDRNMIFVTGPLFAGKQEYIMRTLGLNEKQFEALAIRDVQNLAAETPMEKLGDLAESLAEKKIVIATEVGGGIIPLDPVERQNREKAGRLACLLAERAETVIRVCCGLPCYLKGR